MLWKKQSQVKGFLPLFLFREPNFEVEGFLLFEHALIRYNLSELVLIPVFIERGSRERPLAKKEVVLAILLYIDSGDRWKMLECNVAHHSVYRENQLHGLGLCFVWENERERPSWRWMAGVARDESGVWKCIYTELAGLVDHLLPFFYTQLFPKSEVKSSSKLIRRLLFSFHVCVAPFLFFCFLVFWNYDGSL